MACDSTKIGWRVGFQTYQSQDHFRHFHKRANGFRSLCILFHLDVPRIYTTRCLDVQVSRKAQTPPLRSRGVASQNSHRFHCLGCHTILRYHLRCADSRTASSILQRELHYGGLVTPSTSRPKPCLVTTRVEAPVSWQSAARATSGTW